MNYCEAAPLLEVPVVEQDFRLREEPHEAVGESALRCARLGVVGTTRAPAIKLRAFGVEHAHMRDNRRHRNAFRSDAPLERVVDVDENEDWPLGRGGHDASKIQLTLSSRGAAVVASNARATAACGGMRESGEGGRIANPMYRESADTNVTTEIHALELSTANGRFKVGTFASLSVLLFVLWAGIQYALPQEIRAWLGTVPAAFGIAAYVLQRKRRRRLRILRHGDALRLVVPDAGVELEFPLECRGCQLATHANSVSTYELYLQLVDGRKRSLLLREVRGTKAGPQTDWFPDNLNRSLVTGSLDVSVPGTLATVRGWVEQLETTRANGNPQ